MGVSISVGICAYNEESNIGNLLENLTQQPFSFPYELCEIIVVSSGSIDRTDEIVHKMAAIDPRIKLISEKERNGKSQALNRFLRVAKGDVFLVISADTFPTTGSLSKLVDAMKPNVGGACARTTPLNDEKNVVGFANRFLWKLHNRVLWEETKDGTINHLGGDMWAIKRGLVNMIPKDIINDDAYIGITLKKKGWKIVHVPEAKVFMMAPKTVPEYIHQRKRILVGHRQLEKITRVYPKTIGAMAWRKPLFLLKFLIHETKELKIRDYPKVLVGLSLEILARILASMDFGGTKKYRNWTQIRTTKTLDAISNLKE